MTLAEKWFTQGEAKGKAEGKAEGRAESLRKLVTLKFGELPPLSRSAWPPPRSLSLIASSNEF